MLLQRDRTKENIMPRNDRESSITSLRWALERNGFSGEELESNMVMLSSESITALDRNVICGVLKGIARHQEQKDQLSLACSLALESMARDRLAERVMNPLVDLMRILPAEKVGEALSPLFTETFRPAISRAPGI
jgi:hypothetical protein